MSLSAISVTQNRLASEYADRIRSAGKALAQRTGNALHSFTSRAVSTAKGAAHSGVNSFGEVMSRNRSVSSQTGLDIKV